MPEIEKGIQPKDKGANKPYAKNKKGHAMCHPRKAIHFEYIRWNRAFGFIGTVFANDPGGRGSIPG